MFVIIQFFLNKKVIKYTKFISNEHGVSEVGIKLLNER